MQPHPHSRQPPPWGEGGPLCCGGPEGNLQSLMLLVIWGNIYGEPKKNRENALIRGEKRPRHMICVTVFPAAAAFKCFNVASSPVTTNFTLTHLVALVRLSVVFQGNRNGIHACREVEKYI